jgi:signal transduction histidine kinase
MVELSEFLQLNRAAVITLWQVKVEAEILKRDLTQEQLLDDLSLLIDQVVETLALRSGNLVEGGRSAVARAHGRQRHTVQHELADVVREYGLLFEAVIELANQLEVMLHASDVLHLSRCLSTCAAEAAEEYANKSTAERRRADFEFVAFLAHEVRNPLYAARVAWELGKQTGEISGASVDRLARSLLRMAELIDHALLQSRLTMVQTGAELHPAPVAVAHLIEAAREDAAVEAEHKRIRVEVDSKVEIVLQGDERLLRSALSNLVCNAVKFTPNGGVVVLRARLQEGHLLVEIEDECGGLPPERAERLFDSFVQGAPGDRRGFGLGLAIARQALEAHRGTVSVKNRPGVGCTFTVGIPLEPAAA